MVTIRCFRLSEIGRSWETSVQNSVTKSHPNVVENPGFPTGSLVKNQGNFSADIERMGMMGYSWIISILNEVSQIFKK